MPGNTTSPPLLEHFQGGECPPIEWFGGGGQIVLRGVGTFCRLCARFVHHPDQYFSLWANSCIERVLNLHPEGLLEVSHGRFWRHFPDERLFAQVWECRHVLFKKLENTYVCLWSDNVHTHKQMLIISAQIYSFQEHLFLKLTIIFFWPISI